MAHTVKLEMNAKPRLFHQAWVEQPDAITRCKLIGKRHLRGWQQSPRQILSEFPLCSDGKNSSMYI